MFLCISIFSLHGQETTQKPSYVGTATTFTHVESLASRQHELTPATIKEVEMEDGRIQRSDENIVPNKGRQVDLLSQNPHPLQGKIPSRAPDLVFDAVSSGSLPTDPSLAIGPDHVFVVFNTGFAIYDKDGNQLVGQTAPNPAIFPSGGCCDLTVSYDPTAVSASNPTPGRWVLSFLTAFQGGAQVAVSDGPDPVNDGWNVYNVAGIDDYNKLSVWSDGYYMTDNNFTTPLYALERQAMIDGEPAANVSIQGFSLPGFIPGSFGGYQVLNVTDDTMPGAGNVPIVYLQDDSFAGVTEDHIKFWNATVDFDDPTNSVISTPQELPVTPFNSIFPGPGFADLDQANGGEALDALEGTIMNQAQFRKFPTHNSAVFNFAINIGTGGNDLAAIRWYEFRQTDDGEPWTLHQEGTYASPDGKHAWMASMAMDNQGNIGMGYTAMNGDNNVPLGVYHTGRFASDPIGVMTIAEDAGVIGNNIDSFGSARYGDYSKIDVDPSDDQTFWFIDEYNSTTNGRSDVVCRFKVALDADNDIGVINIDAPIDGDLSAPQDVTVTIFNFGLNDASGFDVTYSIDGTTVATEAFPGTIASATSEQFTFTTQGDFSVEGQTYEITASTTNFAADEFAGNDATTRNVTHLNPDDVGAISVTAPISDASQVTIEIQNFGTTTQTSIPVFYTLNGGTPVQETYTGSIVQGATDTYTFTTTEDLSALGDYIFIAGTELPGDADDTNDDTTATITNEICEPTSNCGGFDDGVTQIALADQDIVTNCGTAPDGYSDDTDIVFNFVLDDNPFEGTLQVGFNDSTFAIWIDFNDNNTFEEDELIVTDLVATANADFTFTVNFNDVVADVTPGLHRMRLRGEDDDQAGDLLNPCDDLAFGRTNDYTANISGTLGTNDTEFSTTELQIHSLGNDLFEVVFDNASVFQERLPITIYNTLGQTLAYYTIENEGVAYRKVIDMSYVSKGVYFVRAGTDDFSIVKRIIVN